MEEKAEGAEGGQRASAPPAADPILNVGHPWALPCAQGSSQAQQGSCIAQQGSCIAHRAAIQHPPSQGRRWMPPRSAAPQPAPTPPAPARRRTRSPPAAPPRTCAAGPRKTWPCRTQPGCRDGWHAEVVGVDSVGRVLVRYNQRNKTGRGSAGQHAVLGQDNAQAQARQQ